jgi:hypothetical protein
MKKLILSLFVACLALTASAEDGHQLWLRYQPVNKAKVTTPKQTPVINTAQKELETYYQGGSVTLKLDTSLPDDDGFSIDIKDGKVRVTYTVQNYDVLTDISGGWLSTTDDSKKTYGDSKRKQDDVTNANLYDEQWEIAKHYPFVAKDAQKRTCAKALVMTHAYSNAVLDKVEEAVKNGIVGNEDDDW